MRYQHENLTAALFQVRRRRWDPASSAVGTDEMEGTPPDHTDQPHLTCAFQPQLSNHTSQPRLPTTASNHSFQPRIQTTPFNHSFQPHSTCCPVHNFAYLPPICRMSLFTLAASVSLATTLSTAPSLAASVSLSLAASLSLGPPLWLPDYCHAGNFELSW